MVSAVYWEKTKMPTYMEWINRIWYIMLMHKIATVIRIRDGDKKATAEFLETWTVFLDFGAKGDQKSSVNG